MAMRTVNPEQHAQRRAKILRAAAEEFAANGMDGTSTAAICRRAGISSGALFHYFKTKKAIFHALFSQDLEDTAEVCAQAVAETDPRAGFELLLDHLCADFADPQAPGLMAAALLQCFRDEKFALLMAADEHRVHTALTVLLERLGGKGSRALFDAADTAAWIQRLVDGAYLAMGGEDFDGAAQARQLRQLVALLVDPPRA